MGYAGVVDGSLLVFKLDLLQMPDKDAQEDQGSHASKGSSQLMRRMMGIATAAALTFSAGVALADEASGAIENIDTVKNTFQVGDKTFQYSSMNTMGAKLDELEEGDTVKIMYTPNTDGTNTVTSLSKEE